MNEFINKKFYDVMEDTIIEYETAKLAKTKGFDIICSYLYENEKDIVYTTHKNSGLNKHHDWYSAPTQSLLQKWLREEYGLLVEIGYYNKEFLIDIFKKDDETFHFDYMHTTPVYELSLEIGLKEALKLIE